jgi:hypothetical protein
MVSKSQKLDDLRLKYAGGILTPEDVRGLEADEVLDLKASARYRSTIASIDKAASTADTVVFDGSTEHRDRMGDVVRVHGRKGGKGWQTKNYERAGSPFLWAHDSSAPPVGRAVKIWRGKSSLDPAVPALKFQIEFHEDRDFPFANLVARLFKSRKMTGSSVGFVIAKSERYGSATEREAAGLGPMGIEITEADLLELSGTPTPANPFALATDGKSAKGGLERVIDEALKDLAAEGGFSETQIREFRSTYPLGPDDAASRLRSRVRGFVDFGGLALPEGESVAEIAAKAAEAIEKGSGPKPPKPDDEPEQKPPGVGYDDDEDDDEDKGKPKRPRKSADGDLIVPKAMAQRFADGLAALQALAADADDLLDLLEGRAIEAAPESADEEKDAGEAQPSEPKPETRAAGSTETLAESILALVDELRAERDARDNANGGAVASEKDAEGPTPELDGEAHKAATEPEGLALSDDAVESCLLSVREARTSTPSKK